MFAARPLGVLGLPRVAALGLYRFPLSPPSLMPRSFLSAWVTISDIVVSVSTDRCRRSLYTSSGTLTIILRTFVSSPFWVRILFRGTSLI